MENDREAGGMYKSRAGREEEQAMQAGQGLGRVESSWRKIGL